MSSRDDLIQEFVSTTGSSTEQAQFFLEMAGWELKVIRKREKKAMEQV